MSAEPEPVPLPPRQNSQGERERARVVLLEYSSLPGFSVQLFPIQSCKPWHELSAFFSAPSSSSSAPLSQTPLLLSPFPRTSSCRPVSFRRLHPEPKLRPAPTHNPAPHAPPPELHPRRPQSCLRQHLRPRPRAPPAPPPKFSGSTLRSQQSRTHIPQTAGGKLGKAPYPSCSFLSRASTAPPQPGFGIGRADFLPFPRHQDPVLFFLSKNPILPASFLPRASLCASFFCE